MLGKGLSLKTTALLVFFLCLVKSCVDHLEKCGLFPDLQYGFRCFRSTADLLTVLSATIARIFNRSGATGAVALNISKALNRVWNAGLLYRLKSYGISDHIFSILFSVTDSFGWLWIGRLHKNIQLMLEFLKIPFLVLHFSCYTLMKFLMMLSVMVISMLMMLP